MNRPGPVGLTILAVFALVAAIEFRTVLKMIGIDVSASTYFPVAGAVVVIGFLLLFVLTDGNRGGPDRGNPSEA